MRRQWETLIVEVPSGHEPYVRARVWASAPVTATAAAIANALADATGVRFTNLPLTAPEVWAALQTSHDG